MRRRGRELVLLGVLGALPVLAHAPAWTEGRLLAPGDGAALHLPMRVAAFRAWAAGELPSWDPGTFSGTPLLASYRPGALHPATALLSWLPELAAFQVLVLGSLAAAGVLAYAYLRQLGGSPLGAYVAGLVFALGPVLAGRLGDSATVAAAPWLLLLLLLLERRLGRAQAGWDLGMATAAALLLLAGSPEAAWAGAAMVALRLAQHAVGRGAGLRPVVFALAFGVLLAAPQLLPTLLAWREAGPGAAGWADAEPALPGPLGLLVRYVSHTPAPALALAALPLLGRSRVGFFAMMLAAALPASLLLPGVAGRAAALALDLALAVLAGLVLSEHEATRGAAGGRRLRAYVLLAGLASAAALSVATTFTGALPQSLAGALGVLALAFILLLALGGAPSVVKAHLFLLPLTVALVLQPHGRGVWEGAPLAAEVTAGTPTRQAIDRVMGPRREELALTLATAWPREAALDLAFGGLGAVGGRRNVNGYDPLVAAARRRALAGMSEAGTLPPRAPGADAMGLEFLGVRFLQIPATALRGAPDGLGLGEDLDLAVDPNRPRNFAVAMTMATEVRIESALSDAVLVPQGTPVALVTVRLATGRLLPLVLRAGVHTAEWAYDRADVAPLMRHAKVRVSRALEPPGATHRGSRYLGVLPLPGRFLVDGVLLEGLRGAGALTLYRVGLVDAATGRGAGVTAAAAWASDAVRFREAAATPVVRLVELRGSLGRARVVDDLRRLESAEEVRAALRAPAALGLDARRAALAAREDVAGLVFPEAARTSRGIVVRSSPGSIELRAQGPGLLVVTEGYDPGWRAHIDGRPAPVYRVNAAALGLVLEEGAHAVRLVHRARGLVPGAALAALALLALLLPLVRRPR